jgi:hypothetical protein
MTSFFTSEINASSGIGARDSRRQGLGLSDHRPSSHLLDDARLTERFKPKATQLGFGFK